MSALVLSLASVALLGVEPIEKGEKDQPRKMIQVKVRVCEGDPLGNKQAGTLKVIAEPRIVTYDGRTARFASAVQMAVFSESEEGKEIVPAGVSFDVLPRALPDGRFRIELTSHHLIVTERSEQTAQFQNQMTRTVTTVRPGEQVKVKFGFSASGQPVWAELTVDEFKKND